MSHFAQLQKAFVLDLKLSADSCLAWPLGKVSCRHGNLRTGPSHLCMLVAPAVQCGGRVRQCRVNCAWCMAILTAASATVRVSAHILVQLVEAQGDCTIDLVVADIPSLQLVSNVAVDS